MIEIKNVQTIDGKRIHHRIESKISIEIDGKDLVLFPALIDPHVHFRTPGAEHKENWESGARAAIAGGVTTVLDMPNNNPSCNTLQRLREKKALIEEQLKRVHIPLRYGLYLGGDRNHLEEIGKAKQEAIALKIYMGSSTGGLLMDDRASLEKAFSIAAENGVLVAVHAEDEHLIQLRRKEFAARSDAAAHSLIRNQEVAARAVALAIELAQKYGTRLYVVHTSTRAELSLIREAKSAGISVYAEASPHHLFLDEGVYTQLGTQALVNPPLRTLDDRDAVWEAIADRTIDTVGTDHAPHTLAEKNAPLGSAPSGFPSVELYFPLLLNAAHEGKISLERIVALTHIRPREIFSLPANSDVVLVDMEKTKKVDNVSLQTRAKWSPYAGRTLKGWPRYTILQGHVFKLDEVLLPAAAE